MKTTRRILFFLLAAVAAFSADESWAKVRELKSGTELRIVKKGSAQPVLAKMDELNGENLIVVVKNEQVAIPKDQIDRIDYRPSRSHVTKETKTTTQTLDNGVPERGPGSDKVGPSSSTSTSVTLGKPDFETIYRRPVGAPKK